MASSARERLAALLAEVAVPGGFSARRSTPVDDLHLEVRGLGPLQLPVPAGEARRLCNLARPARYGLGERTLLDPRVRDTWEIPKSRVTIDQRRWNRTLLPMLDHLRADLGMPAGCALRAQLHSMLVYAPGQFFVPHQDSEEDDDMVATLVVMLPSASRGGSLVVEHAGRTVTYRGSQRLLSFVAFYADCRHEVRPVTSGYRVVLTYNLLLRGDATAAASTVPPAPGVVEAQADCLEEHFATAAAPTTRLVYLLDHAYTARSLGWARLKGSDTARVAALRAAAQRAECATALALAEVHETWSCAEPDWGTPRRQRRDWWDDEPDDDEDWDSSPDEGHELDELLDWETTLDRWIDDRPGASIEGIVSTVRDDEVCATTPTSSLPPEASDYEGYMGNYGNTMDRWYRRAAVVVWPRRHDFPVRAQASPRWALDTLSTHLQAGDVAQAQELTAALAGFWDDAVRAVLPSAGVGAPGEPNTELFARALQVAHGLDRPDLAVLLLTPFRLNMLEPAHAPALARLGERYGKSWAGELLAAWSGQGAPWRHGDGYDRNRWITSLDALCAELRDAGDAGTMLARLLLDDSWQWLADAIDTWRLDTQPSRREKQLGELAEPIAAVLTGVATIGAAELRDRAVAFLRDGGDTLLPCLVQVLRAAADLPAAARVEAGIDVLAGHCIQRLEARLGQPPRHPDDWSIAAPAGCECTLCSSLADFLTDPARRELEWPLAEQKRRHVHARIDAHELPVRHRTRRVGRPYTLVLTKTAELFEREARARHRDQADLTWLRQDGPHTP